MELDRLLDGLPPQAKKVFLLAQVDGCTYAEIAEQLGPSPASSATWPRPPSAATSRSTSDGPAQERRATHRPAVAAQAVQWLVELQDGTPSRQRQDDWQRWRAADPEHERAWQRIESVNRGLRGLNTPPPSPPWMPPPRAADARP